MSQKTHSVSNLSFWQRIFISRSFRLPRVWSNQELAKLAHLFSGDVINVSGWLDEDKQGNHYKNYFINANNYCISNYGGERGKSDQEDFQIDLEADLPEELKSKFDVVFNHTTLEHIFDIFQATQNLCLLSKDIVILIVPFVQQVHHQSSYLDYWRFTQHSLNYLFDKNGFKVIYLNSSPYKNASIYHFCIASKYPEKWVSKLENYKTIINTGNQIVREPLIAKLSWQKIKTLIQKIN